MSEHRQYQFDMCEEINFAWQSGVRNVMGVLPTGGGKSEIFTTIMRDWQEPNVAIAHRQELVSQISMHLSAKGVMHRIIAPKKTILGIVNDQRDEFGKSFYSPSARAAVAGVDTINARIDDLKQWASQITLWVMDEAHHVLRGNKWGNAVALFPNARGLGVTATPKRADGRGLGMHSDGVFQYMVQGPNMRDLIGMGFLSEYQIVVPASDFNRENLRLGVDGDFTIKAMREASRNSRIVGDVVREYIKWACGKKGITFATDVETAGEIAAEYNKWGVPAAAISGNTDPIERRNLIKQFKAGQLWQLVNVDLFGEGFDVPAVEVISMARPTQSLAVFMQQFGRGLRIMPGKTLALIIDHVSNVRVHGLPDKLRFWSMDGKEKRTRDKEEIPLTICTNRDPPCGKPYERIYRRCPYCGFIPEPGEGGRRSVEQVDGDLLLLDPDVLAQMRQAIVLETPGALADRVGQVAGQYAATAALRKQQERLAAQAALNDALAYWAGVANAGKDHAELHRRFYFKNGVDVLSALALPRADMDKIRETLS